MTAINSINPNKYQGSDLWPFYGFWEYIKRNEDAQTQQFVDRATILTLYNAGVAIGIVKSLEGLEKIIRQIF